MNQVTRFWTYDSGEARLELELENVPPPPKETRIEMRDAFYRVCNIRYVIDSPDTEHARMRVDVELATSDVHGR